MLRTNKYHLERGLVCVTQPLSAPPAGQAWRAVGLRWSVLVGKKLVSPKICTSEYDLIRHLYELI